MAPSKAASDPETLEFEARVDRGGTDVVLSETYFYPEGGGQPADRGTLGGLPILDVQADDGGIVHTVGEPLEAGSTVIGAIDPAFRQYCTRAHTASHALYGAGRRIFDELGYGGFDITPEKVRVDLTTPTPIDDQALVDLERLTNRCVVEARPVRWQQLPKDEALARDDIAFNTKTEEGVTGETVRVVEIDDWDIAACGGTHVSNTIEIGPVTVLGRSNPGEGLTRIECTVGATAIDRRATEKRALLDAAGTLETSIESVADETARLKSERDDVQTERDALQEEMLTHRVSEIASDSFTRDGHTWAAGVVDASVNALSEAIRKRPADLDVLVLVTPKGQLAVGASPVDAGSIVDELTDAFGGGGGGSHEIAQAGGLDADSDEILAYLQK